MVTPSAARDAAAGVYARRFAGWAVDAAVAQRTGAPGPAQGSLVDRPLHPPAERAALADPAGVAAWISTWRDADPAAGTQGHVDWSSRRWASMGTQVVPERLTLGTPDAVARFAGKLSHWRTARARATRVLDALSSRSGHADAVPNALARVLGIVADLDEPDLDRLVGVLAWVLSHDADGLFVRQLPVRGVDTKWLERHRRLVDPLYAAATGNDALDLAARPSLVRARFLDPTLAPAGLRDVLAPVGDLAQLDIAPRVVVVVENLESLLSLPDTDDVVAVHGQGYAARLLHQIDWVAPADIVYWGDLDTDGLNILSAVRSHLPHTRSILMDRATLTTHLDLAVPEPRPRRAQPDHLTITEADAFVALRELGDVRLEQERLPWATAVDALNAALQHYQAPAPWEQTTGLMP